MNNRMITDYWTMQLEYVKHFLELEDYKRQRTLAREVFVLSKKLPRELLTTDY